MELSSPRRSSRFFRWLTKRPRRVVAVAAIAVLAAASFLPNIRQDSRVEAFIPPDQDCLLFREEVRERFGMADPMVILLVQDADGGIFRPGTLALLRQLTDAARKVRGVEAGGVSSLATLRVPAATGDGFELRDIVSGKPTDSSARAARELVGSQRGLRNTLVSADGHSTLIVVERFDEALGAEIYEGLRSVVAAADLSGGEKLYVAGHGALTATLGSYIDSDTRILYLAVTALLSLVLFTAFRTAAGVLLPLLLIGSSLAVCMGVMALSGAAFTVISSALPVVLSALVVTDALHILSLYYQRQAAHPSEHARELVVAAMSEAWRPCVGARVTDIAGFAGLYLGSVMPPMKSFGLFGALGIAAELLLALLAYPCLLVLVAPTASPAFAREGSSRSLRAARRLLELFGGLALRRPRPVLLGGMLVLAAGLSGMSLLVVNDSWTGNFDSGSEVRRASDELERRHGLLTDADVLIDSRRPDGVLEPKLLRAIAALEEKLESAPHATQAQSLRDLLLDLDAALRGSGEQALLPESEEQAAQYLLLADSQAARRWVDEDQQRALVRVHSTARDTLAEIELLSAVRSAAADTVPGALATVSIGGMAAVGVAWVSSVGNFHVLSTTLSVLFCWLQMALGFRSLLLACLAIVPMTAAMMLMYAVMGWTGIPLGIGTSMFAALAIGTGVDFAIHAIDRLLVLRERGCLELASAMQELLPTTGRSILFSAAAIVLGFSVLGLSSIPAVRSLGILVTIAVASSFVATFTLLPAILQLLKPRILFGESS